MRFVFTFTIFVGAFLLFLVQPMFARMLLPRLGGSPSVWNTAMVFYQAALLAGYAYAHFAVEKLGAKRQPILHFIFICLPLLVLPIGLAPNISPPNEGNPVLWMLGLMTLSVGLPFLLVSTTSPLLQRWFHATGDESARDPYFLYAAGNAGSLLALLAYPTLIEPNFPLEMQSRIWSWGYGVLIASVFACGFLLWRETKTHSAALEYSRPHNEEAAASPISNARRGRWVLLAFVPSSLMLSVTTYLTTDIAAVPLLWIIPLTLYLLTFILVFASRQILPHALVLKVFPFIVLPLVVVIAATTRSPLMVVMLIHLIAFFVTALACHGELAKDRPAPLHLTEFYLWMSLGGVLGGAFNALLAPLLFRGVTEYPLVLVLACVMILPAVKNADAREETLDTVLDVVMPVVIGASCAALILILQSRGATAERYVLGLMFGFPAFISLAFLNRALRFGLAVGAIFLASTLRVDKDETLLATTRSFFGIYRVERVATPTGFYHRFVHGSTLHGLQSVSPERAREPLTYYAQNGPLGLAFAALREKQGADFDAIGAIGLGAGTAAAYATANQKWTFYEIDPTVQAIAENPGYFTYLRECRAPYKIVIGDGRLQLQSAPDATFDLLILDAYSSDSLPIHLLTKQALELYARKLAPGGAMIFNISNRHLDLEPQMNALAKSIKWHALQYDDGRLPKNESDRGKTASQWVILARRESDFGGLIKDEDWKKLRARENVFAWTDTYSSLLSVFMWK